jgi:S-adenosylmethionine:tRNA ribosyltransferase-isomerase
MIAAPDVLDGRRLDPAHEAGEPPEATGRRRDDVRLMVSPGPSTPVDARFRDLFQFLAPEDLLVVNDSATVPAALDGRLADGSEMRVHLSTELPGGLWLVEVRTPSPAGSGVATEPRFDDVSGTVTLRAGGRAELLARFGESRRLWFAALHLPEPVLAFLDHHGRPIRYRHVERDWPIEAYQSVFGTVPGSAEMPSASRPFTAEVVADLAAKGVSLAPITLHTGVASLEGDEAPYPERFVVPAATAAAVNRTRDEGGHVVAIGTTVVRALESAVDAEGVAHPASGWTEVIITAERGVGAVDGLLTGWHEPEASHLHMLEAVAGIEALRLAYRAAFESGYRWHEFGDSHLVLPYAGADA